MSRELQERAEKITKELKEALVPLRKEISKMRHFNNTEAFKNDKVTTPF